MQISRTMMAVVVCILLGLCFATGYLLLSRHEGGLADRPGDGGSVEVAPGTVPAVAVAPVNDVAPRAGTVTPAVPGAGAGGNRPAGAGGSCTFDATVYDVRMSADQISHVSVEALTKEAGTREGFEKALAALGTTRQVARAHQAANFNEEQYVKLTNETPYVTASSVTATGQTVNTVAFRSTGSTFDLIAHEGTLAAPGSGVITLDIAIKTIVLLEGATQLTGTVKAPVFRTLDVQTQQTVMLDKPFLFVSADGSSLDAEGKAVALIARVVLSRPQVAAGTLPAGK